MKNDPANMTEEEFEAFMETPVFAVIAEEAMLSEMSLEDSLRKYSIFSEEELRRQQLLSNERRISLGMPPLYPDVK